MSQPAPKPGPGRGNRTGRGCFKPGQSGNPSGKPRGDVSLRALCRTGADEAFARLMKVIRSDDDGKAVDAIKVLFDRGFGRPVQAIDGDGEGGAIEMVVRWAERETS